MTAVASPFATRIQCDSNNSIVAACSCTSNIPQNNGLCPTQHSHNCHKLFREPVPHVTLSDILDTAQRARWKPPDVWEADKTWSKAKTKTDYKVKGLTNILRHTAKAYWQNKILDLPEHEQNSIVYTHHTCTTMCCYLVQKFPQDRSVNKHTALRVSCMHTAKKHHAWSS